jgi:type IV pilus assembly protein PilQ
MALAASEANSQIHAIDLMQEGDRLRLAISISGSSTPPEVFFSQEGDAWVGDIRNVKLNLNGQTLPYRQEAPAPGVAYLEASQQDASSVRIRVVGENGPPSGLMSQRSAEQLVFDFQRSPQAATSKAKPIASPETLADAAAPTSPANSVYLNDGSGLVSPVDTYLAQPGSAAPAAAMQPSIAPVPVASLPQSVEANGNPADGKMTGGKQAGESSSTRAVEFVASEGGAGSQGDSASEPVDQPTWERTSLAQAAPQADSTPAYARTSPPDLFELAEQARQSAPASTSTVTAQAPAIPSPSTPAAPATVPPLAAKAVATAPPVGDIAIGNIDLTPDTVDLGSQETVSLTLKDAPVSDVLSLLVRRAGLNVVLNDVDAESKVSLDVQDTPLQDVFNSVIRLNELQSARVGETIFLGKKLPGVQGKTVRTFRLNQAYVEDASLQPGGLTQSGGQTLEVKGILPTLEGLAQEGGPLEGVKFIGDTRTNSITAVGTPQLLDIVAAQIAQLDVRKRQVMLAVKLVDVTLTDDSSLGVALASTSGNFATTGTEPDGDFGAVSPDRNDYANVDQNEFVGPIDDIEVEDDGITITPSDGPSFLFNSLLRLRTAVALRINAAIDEGTAKILADPRVVVGDGGSSTLQIGQEVITNVKQEVDAATGQTTESFEKGNAGVTVNLRNVRVDDNGFISLDLSPQVSSPGELIQLSGGAEITLLNQRTLDTQQIRLRDGETFVLSGLIQDIDRVTVEKVPLLGDIPILGTLFRTQNTENDRTEVVLMVTPYVLQEDQVASLP